MHKNRAHEPDLNKFIMFLNIFKIYIVLKYIKIYKQNLSIYKTTLYISNFLDALGTHKGYASYSVFRGNSEE